MKKQRRIKRICGVLFFLFLVFTFSYLTNSEYGDSAYFSMDTLITFGIILLIMVSFVTIIGLLIWLFGGFE